MTYNDFFNLARNRRSIRKYTKNKINQNDIDKILYAGIQAPSPANSQGWKFRILNNAKVIKNLCSIIENKLSDFYENIEDGILKKSFINYSKNFIFFKNAPCVIILYSQKPKILLNDLFPSKNSFIKGQGAFLSLGMVMQNMMLAAHTMGISSCAMTGPLIAEKDIVFSYKNPPKYELAALLTLGYAQSGQLNPGRKQLDKFIII